MCLEKVVKMLMQRLRLKFRIIRHFERPKIMLDTTSKCIYKMRICGIVAKCKVKTISDN